jgi:hypothetical protein
MNMWEVISAIAGVISAVCAVIGVQGLRTAREPQGPTDGAPAAISSRALFAFLLVCSGWTLGVLSFLWVVQPYGSYLRRDDYMQIVGIIAGLPAFIVLMSGLDMIQGDGGAKKKES